MGIRRVCRCSPPQEECFPGGKFRAREDMLLRNDGRSWLTSSSWMNITLKHAAIAKTDHHFKSSRQHYSRVAMVLRLLNRMESAAGDPFVPVHPRRWLLQTLSGFIGVLVNSWLLVQLRQLMKINGRVVIYCARRHLLSVHHSGPSRSKTNVSSFDSSRCCLQPCCIDYVQILWHGVFKSSLLKLLCLGGITCVDAGFAQSTIRVHVAASNRPRYWTFCQIHPFLETDIMSIHSRLEVLCWQFPCRSFDRACLPLHVAAVRYIVLGCYCQITFILPPTQSTSFPWSWAKVLQNEYLGTVQQMLA